MKVFKRMLVALLLGAIAGIVVATPIAAAAIPWYNTPATGQALCSCAETAHVVVWQLVRWQAIGAGIGALVLIILTAIVGHRRRPSAPAPSAPAVP